MVCDSVNFVGEICENVYTAFFFAMLSLAFKLRMSLKLRKPAKELAQKKNSIKRG